MMDKVREILGEIRPQLQETGSDIELIDVKNGVVTVKMGGACAGCSMALICQSTVKMGLERYIKSKIPGVNCVVAV